MSEAVAGFEPLAWVSAYQARAHLVPNLAMANAERQLINRAAAGLLLTRAQGLVTQCNSNVQRSEKVELAPSFWVLESPFELEQDWEAGDFVASHMTAGGHIMQSAAYGVEFEFSGVRQIVGHLGVDIHGESSLHNSPYAASFEELMVSDRTGAPGRPTSMPHIQEMMEERISKGEHEPSMRREAQVLARLFGENQKYRGLVKPTARTIENSMAQFYRQLTKNITK